MLSHPPVLLLSLHHDEIPFMIHPLVQAVVLLLRTEPDTSGLNEASAMNGCSGALAHLLVQLQDSFFTDVPFGQVDRCEQRDTNLHCL